MLKYALALLALAILHRSYADPSVFHSRPDLRAPTLNVSHHDAPVNRGFLFMTPSFPVYRALDSGPYIFDESGNLVWSGVDDSNGAGQTDVQGLHVCQYNDEDHLCFWKGRQRDIHGRGVGVVMNRNYEVVKTIRPTNLMVDLHEFRLISSHSALFTAYTPRLHDGMWLLDSLFQEIDLITGQTIFQWSALDHVKPSESHVAAGSYSAIGDGSEPSRAYNFFHLNSIDKNAEGDYLISARHMDCVYKLSHQDGSIMLELHGDNSSSNLSNFKFRRQHHARFITESSERTKISLFDNDNDGFTAHGSQSRGRLIEIDRKTGIAREIVQFNAPIPGGHASPSMGSVEALPGGHYLVNWGERSIIAEYNAEGSVVWSAELGSSSRNYRTQKANWIGQPRQPPALYSFATSTSSSTHICVSWNGATEVRSWRIYASLSSSGPFELLKEIQKEGFETCYQHTAYVMWTMVEAIGQSGSLGKSLVVESAIHPQGEVVAAPSPDPRGGAGDDRFLLGEQNTAQSVSNQLWRYLEHIMAVIGAAFCLARGVKLLGRTRRRGPWIGQG